MNDKIHITIENGDSVEATAPIIISASRSTDIPAFCQAVEKPLGVKGWYICGAAGGNYDRSCCFYIITLLC